MFQVANAKRVKRSHLFREEGSSQDSREGSTSESPEELKTEKSEARRENAHYGFEYDFISPGSPSVALQPQDDGEDTTEPEYQFRLFHTTPTSKSQEDQPQQPDRADTRIKLSATPEPAALAESLSLDNAHFVRPHRPEAYYFTSKLPDEIVRRLKLEYETAAVSTLDVLSRAKSTPWPGASLPWRCFEVQLLDKRSLSSQKKIHSTTGHPTSQTVSLVTGRARPSKKRRILHRRRLALRNELATKAKATEETEQEKRTRRNREKKVKKKVRDKMKKLEASGEGPSGQGHDNSGLRKHENENATGKAEAVGMSKESEPSTQKMAAPVVEPGDIAPARPAPLKAAKPSPTAKRVPTASTSRHPTRKQT